MVWGVAAFFFTMTHPLASDALYWGRDYTNEQFMKMRKMLVNTTTEGGAGIFGEALLDPTKFKLSDFLGDDSPAVSPTPSPGYGNTIPRAFTNSGNLPVPKKNSENKKKKEAIWQAEQRPTKPSSRPLLSNADW